MQPERAEDDACAWKIYFGRSTVRQFCKRFYPNAHSLRSECHMERSGALEKKMKKYAYMDGGWSDL